MKLYKIIPTVTAVVLTLATVAAINYNVPVQATGATATRFVHVTNFAPIHVYPSAAEIRAVSALDGSLAGDFAMTSASGAHTGYADASFKLVGSAISVPHYAFEQKTGRTTKE